MTLDEIHKEFSMKMKSLHLNKYFINDLFKKEVESLIEYEKKSKEYFKKNKDFDNELIESMRSSHHNFFYYHIDNGETIFYARESVTIEERFKTLYVQKNRQYQWLLAEVYEEFEDFLEKIYAYIGYKDNNTWLLNDFGNISFNELNDKGYSWFLDRAKNKKDVPKSILERLRIIFPELLKIETKNTFKINLKLAITLIENIRHIIVHKGGIVDCKETFINNTLKKAGLFNNGKPEEENIDLITQFFGIDEYENYIRLLEVSSLIHPDIKFEITHDVFKGLTNFLLSYAFFIEELVLLRYLNKKD